MEMFSVGSPFYSQCIISVAYLCHSDEFVSIQVHQFMIKQQTLLMKNTSKFGGNWV